MDERMNRPVVTVILATYNGELFLPEQLESLATQSRMPDRIVLRDDGSVDRSVEIVKAWADQNGVALQQVNGPRLGPARSFLRALQVAQPADIFLFCDQDDVWQPYKIERALDHLPWGGGVAPTLYATQLEVVDEQLNFLRLSSVPKCLSFGSAVCESLLTGCTMAFNAGFRELLVRVLPEHAAMHDWWCYLLATSAIGSVLCFDSTPTVRYRQHSGNALGAGPIGWRALRARGQRFFRRDSNMRSMQLQEFAKLYESDLAPNALRILSQLLDAKCGLGPRVRATFTAPIRRQTVLATLTTRVALLTNRF